MHTLDFNDYVNNIRSDNEELNCYDILCNKTLGAVRVRVIATHSNSANDDH